MSEHPTFVPADRFQHPSLRALQQAQASAAAAMAAASSRGSTSPTSIIMQDSIEEELQETLNMATDGRRRRRRRLDPTKLDLDALSGEENVSVINRETGKKVCLSYACYSLLYASLCQLV